MLDHLRIELEKKAKPQNKDPMEAYMKHKFTFLGVKSPERREASKAILMELRNEKDIQWDFVFNCFEQEEREFHYIACDYLRKVQRKLTHDDLANVKSLICTHSWWDTVDALAIEVGTIGHKHPEIRQSVLPEWSKGENLWLRRVSIIHQLRYKEKTDLEFLASSIQSNLGSKKFFINKAIGWALRSYSAVNPRWVIQFCDSHDLHSLSKKEALRKIN